MDYIFILLQQSGHVLAVSDQAVAAPVSEKAKSASIARPITRADAVTMFDDAVSRLGRE